MFDSRSEFSFTERSARKNVIILGADMGSSVHIDNENKDILILGEGLTQGLDATTLAAEAKYSINFTKSGKRFVYNKSLQKVYTIMEATIFDLLMLQKYINSKQHTLK